MQFYVSYFQRPGGAEADVRAWLRGIYTTLGRTNFAGTTSPSRR